MLGEGIVVDRFVYIIVLCVCVIFGDLEKGKEVYD